jgi:hypothetical protein
MPPRDPSGPSRHEPVVALRRLYPQFCGLVDTRRALICRGDGGRSGGDHRRLVEKLSPGMCTGWGDLVCAGSRPVIDGLSTPGRRPCLPSASRAADLHISLPSPTWGRRRAGPASLTCALPGDGAGRGRGQGVEERRPRCTPVVLSTCRQQEDADHPQSANRAIRALSSGKRSDPQLPHL